MHVFLQKKDTFEYRHSIYYTHYDKFFCIKNTRPSCATDEINNYHLSLSFYVKMSILNNRSRSKNYSLAEKDLLLDCIMPFKAIIECAVTNKKSNVKKSETWLEIENLFNAQNDYPRSAKSLKNMYLHYKTNCLLKSTGCIKPKMRILLASSKISIDS